MKKETIKKTKGTVEGDIEVEFEILRKREGDVTSIKLSEWPEGEQ